MNTSEVTLELVLKAYEKCNYVWYKNPFKLNIFGIRDVSNVDTFNDVIGYCYYSSDSSSIFEVFQATTDPGLKMLKKPMNSKGCAILVEGQYIDGWKKGLHQGKYSAFIQNKEVTVYRDSNRDSKLDCNRGINGANLDKGWHGINIHRASENIRTTVVGGYSAGCQVIADPCDFKKLLKARDISIKYGYDTFTYTLFTLDQFKNC